MMLPGLQKIAAFWPRGKLNEGCETESLQKGFMGMYKSSKLRLNKERGYLTI